MRSADPCSEAPRLEDLSDPKSHFDNTLAKRTLSASASTGNHILSSFWNSRSATARSIPHSMEADSSLSESAPHDAPTDAGKPWQPKASATRIRAAEPAEPWGLQREARPRLRIGRSRGSALPLSRCISVFVPTKPKSCGDQVDLASHHTPESSPRFRNRKA